MDDPVSIGIDVSKHSLDIAVLPSGSVLSVPNDANRILVSLITCATGPASFTLGVQRTGMETPH